MNCFCHARDGIFEEDLAFGKKEGTNVYVQKLQYTVV